MDTKIIVIDDDPTGNQTVHSCPLLTEWSPSILEKGLDVPSSLMFILSNTRALDVREATAVTREICRNLHTALERRHQPALFVSRSDSTLRGHYPVETDVIAKELGPFDAHFLIPAFFEGGRVTIDGIHYIRDHGRMIRTDETEFARDSVFGYSTSYLPDYVEEKTGGRIRASDVIRLPILESAEAYYEQLRKLGGNRCVAVDAIDYKGLNCFAAAVMRAVASGKRFLFRSAASVLSALADLPPQPIPPEEIGRLCNATGTGIVVVGSHVQRTSEQLEQLLRVPDVVGIELKVERLPHERDACLSDIRQRLESARSMGKGVVVYTSRHEMSFVSKNQRIAFGKAVSDVLVRVVRDLPASTRFLIGKGGITSNDILSAGLELAMCSVVGQIIPGCTVVTTPVDHRLPGLPVVIFPGNVGGPDALREVYLRLDRGRKR